MNRIMSQSRCPVCGRPVQAAAPRKIFPFCSQRCKLVDLGRWLDGQYAVASKAPFGEGDELYDKANANADDE